MPEIDIREAIPQDEDVLVNLWWDMQQSHHDYEPVWYGDVGEDESKALWKKWFHVLLADDDYLVIVATCFGQPVGMLVARFSERPPFFVVRHVVTICDVVVGPEFRRRGVCRGLIENLEDRAKELGCTAVQLGVHKDNPAVGVYERVGFSVQTFGMVKLLE